MSAQKQKIKIRFKAYDHKILDQAVQKIASTINRTGATMVGPIPLPYDIEKFTVNRSPHIDKKSREQFEIRTHKRLIIIDPNQRALDALMQIDLAAGVDVAIEVVTKTVGGKDHA
jgi:small subunit ribosomal protein S10